MFAGSSGYRGIESLDLQGEYLTCGPKTSLITVVFPKPQEVA